MKRTPLHSAHVTLGAKMVPFAGWEMPIQYAGLIEEHKAVRTGVGIFDVSHMGEIFVSGDESEALLDHFTCNNVKSLTNGKAQYSALINPEGGVIDDIIIYRITDDNYLVCVNASNADKDFRWLFDTNEFDAVVENRSSEFGQIAIQGPKSSELMAKVFRQPSLKDLKYFTFEENAFLGTPVIVARTGYTGEDGFEVFIPWDKTEALWNALLNEGATPCGLGARDTLRLEVCYPLHGHELSDELSAIESGLGWIVKEDKGDFIGRNILAEHKSKGAPRSLVGFFVEDQGIVREGAKLFDNNGSEVGFVTSGTKTPTVNKALGLGIVKKDSSKVGTELFADVRGKKLKCRVVKRPFYKTQSPPPS